MTLELWDSVDKYFNKNLLENDYSFVLENQSNAGLPDINVTPTQGMFLNLLSKTLGSKRILEIGTLGGYSTIWLSKSLPEGGKLVTLELSEKHASVARKNLEKAGLLNRVEIIVGQALDSLPKLVDNSHEPFDLVFIDADKANIPQYFEYALKLTRPGSLIVVDNTVREGKVIDINTKDESVQGVRRFIELLSKTDSVEATSVQTVGSKGHDGFVMIRVK